MALALNTLTRQQVWAAQRLAQHAGKTVCIKFGGFRPIWSIESEGQLSHVQDDLIPDVTLEILVEKFNPLSWVGQTNKPDIAEYVNVSGQAALAQVMSELARDLRPDPEDALSQWLGDVSARRIVRGAQGALSAVRTFGASLTQNLAEYLSEETDALVGKPALLMQRDMQTELLASLERLEQRQSTLQAKLQQFERASGDSK